jgi:tripartite-type tricarboxylate transporter receptor subunit TctC
VLAPAAVSRDVVARLNTAIVQVVNMPQMTEAFVRQGLEVRTTTPEQFAAFIRGELAQNAKLAKFAGIRAE